jgi:molybdopterin-containing oxidoreductase family membrane subunit
MIALLAKRLARNGTATTNIVLATSAAVLVGALLTTFYFLIFEGHTAFNTKSEGVAWGLPIITYVFLVLTSTGLTFVASIAILFGFDDFYPVAKRCIWLAVAALVSGFTSLGLELGHPLRMLWAMPTGLQYVSPMFWMGVFYSVYLAFLLLKFWRIQRGDWGSRLSKTLGVASFVSVVVAHATLGLVFGMMAMRPAWYSDLMPLYFLVTAGLSGAAFAVFFSYLAYGFDRRAMPSRVRELMSGDRLPNIFATLIGVTLLMVLSRAITGYWTNLDGMQAVREMVASPLFQFELWACLVLPFVLMVSRRVHSAQSWQIFASVMVIIGLFIGRYDYMVSGQRVPLFKGAWMPELAQYTPSLAEWMITLVAFSLVFFIYAAGEKLFDLAAAPPAKSGTAVPAHAVPA